jgi:hypothetical protein
VNRKLISLAAAFAVSATPVVIAAQASAPAHAQRAVGPTVAAATVGVRAPTAAKANAKVAATQDTHLGAGQNVAFMVVGGAAIVIGAIVGGAGGILLAIGGAALGLYGLYNFIQ